MRTVHRLLHDDPVSQPASHTRVHHRPVHRRLLPTQTPHPVSPKSSGQGNYLFTLEMIPITSCCSHTRCEPFGQLHNEGGKSARDKGRTGPQRTGWPHARSHPAWGWPCMGPTPCRVAQTSNESSSLQKVFVWNSFVDDVRSADNFMERQTRPLAVFGVAPNAPNGPLGSPSNPPFFTPVATELI